MHRAEIPKAWSPPRAPVPTENVGWVQILGPTPELLSQKTGCGMGVAPCVLADFQGDRGAGHLQTPGVGSSLSHLTCKQGRCCGFSKEKPHTGLAGAQSSSNQLLGVSYDPILFCGPRRSSRGPHDKGKREDKAKGNLISKVACSPPVMGNSACLTG